MSFPRRVLAQTFLPYCRAKLYVVTSDSSQAYGIAMLLQMLRCITGYSAKIPRKIGRRVGAARKQRASHLISSSRLPHEQAQIFPT